MNLAKLNNQAISLFKKKSVLSTDYEKIGYEKNKTGEIVLI